LIEPNLHPWMAICVTPFSPDNLFGSNIRVWQLALSKIAYEIAAR